MCLETAERLGGAALAGQHVWVYWWDEDHVSRMAVLTKLTVLTDCVDC